MRATMKKKKCPAPLATSMVRDDNVDGRSTPLNLDYPMAPVKIQRATVELSV